MNTLTLIRNQLQILKGNVKELFESYLSDQVASLQTLLSVSHQDQSQTYSLNYYLKEYKQHVQYFNKKFGGTKKEYDFKRLEKTLYGNQKTVIKQ